jgi:hypothetical protein
MAIKDGIKEEWGTDHRGQGLADCQFPPGHLEGSQSQQHSAGFIGRSEGSQSQIPFFFYFHLLDIWVLLRPGVPTVRRCMGRRLAVWNMATLSRLRPLMEGETPNGLANDCLDHHTRDPA